MKIKKWNIEALTGYKPKTTYFEDFSIADNFGIEAIKQTYDMVMKDIKSLGYIYITELVMALNWKIWQHYEEGNEKYSRLYDKLWRKAEDYAIKNLKGEELSYYFETID